MGVVYKARHSRLGRWVALKVMAGGEFASADFKQRFRTEAQAAAALEHPNIIPIYEVGEEDGQPYFSMKLVAGGTLTSWRPVQKGPIGASRDEPLDSGSGALGERNRITSHEMQRSDEMPLQRLRAIAAALIKLARAVQFAHERGVLHRDLKPNNVLVDSAGELFLTDFGLAKLVEKEASLTKTIAVLGTPSYMAPEQARGDARHITTAADVYGLGAILYELIAGRPPFTGQSPLEIIKQVLEREPPAPSVAAMKNGGGFTTTATSHPARDLDTICLKCLEKEPNRRYASARALAEDLERWLNHEPIHARQASVLERVGKWIRRKPAWAALIGTVLLSLVALGAGSVLFTAQVMKARTAAEQASRELSRDLFIRQWVDAESLLDEGKIASALAWFARAARDHPADAALQTRLLSLLTEQSFVVPADRPLVHGSPINTATFLSGDGHLATAALDGSVRVWRLDSHSEPLILSNHFEKPAVGAMLNPNQVLVSDAHSVSVWNLNGLVKLVPISHKVNRRLPVSPDGRFAAIYGPGNGLRLWDIAELKPIGPLIEGIEPYPGLTGLGPDGKYLLGTDKSTQLFAWEISSGRLVWQTPPNTPLFRGEGLVQAEVTPTGDSVITSCWVATPGGELSGWTFKPSLSPDAGLATASPEGWTLPTRSPIGAWCFSKDGQRLYVGDAEGHLGVVNLSTHELHTLNAEHEGRVSWLGLSSDGQRLATASIDGTARLWDVGMKTPEPVMIANGASEMDAKFSPDSRWFVCSGPDGAEIHDARSGALLKRLPLNQPVTHVDISPDGRRVVACGDGRAVVWDANTGAPLYPAIEIPSLDYVEFSDDGRWFLLRSGNTQIQIHETETGRQIGPTLTTSWGVNASFNPDNRSFVVGTDNGAIEIWSLPEGHRLDQAARHKDVVWTARFNQDGKLLLTASRDRTAALWDAHTGRLVREFRHEQQVYNAAFSPDGSRIVTCDASGKAHIWDSQTGKRLFSLPAHPGGVWYGEFSSDGQLLLTGDDTGNARVWEASSGLPLSGWVHNGRSLRSTYFSPDGRMGISAAANGTLRLWPVVIAPLPAPSWLPELAEALAGHRLRDDGSPEPVPAERWQALRTSLSAQTGDDFYARWSRWFFVERFKEKPTAFVP